METLESKIISIDNNRFDVDVKRYATRKELEKQMINEVKLLVNKAIIPKDFFNDVMGNFYKIVEHSVKNKNLMEIKGLQLITLLEIDFSKLYSLVEKYQRVRTTEKPNINAFTLYANGDEEISRLSLCEKVINHLKEIQDIGHSVYPLNIRQAYNGMFVFDVRTGAISPNSQWIKQSKY